MKFINKIMTSDGGQISVYRTKTGKKMEVLMHQIPGIQPRKRVKLYGEDEMPVILRDSTRNGVDIYTKAEDGTTNLLHNKKKSLLSHVDFAELVNRFFK